MKYIWFLVSGRLNSLSRWSYREINWSSSIFQIKGFIVSCFFPNANWQSRSLRFSANTSITRGKSIMRHFRYHVTLLWNISDIFRGTWTFSVKSNTLYIFIRLSWWNSWKCGRIILQCDYRLIICDVKESLVAIICEVWKWREFYCRFSRIDKAISVNLYKYSTQHVYCISVKIYINFFKKLFSVF